jgi:hypothetical protein
MARGQRVKSARHPDTSVASASFPIPRGYLNCGTQSPLPVTRQGQYTTSLNGKQTRRGESPEGQLSPTECRPSEEAHSALGGPAVAWLMHYATSWKVASSIPKEVIPFVSIILDAAL